MNIQPNAEQKDGKKLQTNCKSASDSSKLWPFAKNYYIPFTMCQYFIANTVQHAMFTITHISYVFYMLGQVWLRKIKWAGNCISSTVQRCEFQWLNERIQVLYYYCCCHHWGRIYWSNDRGQWRRVCLPSQVQFLQYNDWLHVTLCFIKPVAIISCTANSNWHHLTAIWTTLISPHTAA